MRVTFPPNPFTKTAFFSYERWLKVIAESPGSNAMKARVVQLAAPCRNGSMIDCFKIGYVLGVFSNQFAAGSEEERDFLATIEGTRDTAKLPIEKVADAPV